MKKLVNVFFLLSWILVSCGNKTTTVVPKEQPKDTSVTEDKPKVTWMSYEGVLPCKKCDGIKTSVSFSSDNKTASVSMSHLDNPFIEEGYDYTMNTERGFEKDEDATVYVLNWDKPEDQQWVFVRETGNDSTIFEIGSNRKGFKDKKNHSLKKVDN